MSTDLGTPYAPADVAVIDDEFTDPQVVAWADPVELSMMMFGLSSGILAEVPDATRVAIMDRWEREVLPLVRSEVEANLESTSGRVSERAVQDHVWLARVTANPLVLDHDAYTRLEALAVKELAGHARSWRAERDAVMARDAEEHAAPQTRINDVQAALVAVPVAAAVAIAASAGAVQVLGNMLPTLLAIPTTVTLGAFLAEQVEAKGPDALDRLKAATGRLFGALAAAPEMTIDEMRARVVEAEIHHPDPQRVAYIRRPAAGDARGISSTGH